MKSEEFIRATRNRLNKEIESFRNDKEANKFYLWNCETVVSVLDWILRDGFQ